MKQKTAPSLGPSLRCVYRTASGRQCRLAVFDVPSRLCPHHHAEQQQKEAADVSEILTRDCRGFQTAQGINHSLKNLYLLVAENRISPRRAAILAYVGSLLLRTLPAIDADRAAHIIEHPHSPGFPGPAPDPAKKPS